MSQDNLTNEDSRSLKLWFRQAIAELEREQITQALLKRHGVETEISGIHRSTVSRPRLRRNKPAQHTTA